MSKVYKILIIALVVIISIKIVYAAGYTNRPFGGKIIGIKAKKIEQLENSNYECTVPGSTIEIKLLGIKGAPTSYYIPSNVNSKKQKQFKVNQSILGTYAGVSGITCIYKGYPPQVQEVVLDTITHFGTSKQ